MPDLPREERPRAFTDEPDAGKPPRMRRIVILVAAALTLAFIALVLFVLAMRR